MNSQRKTLAKAVLIAAFPLLFAAALLAQDSDPPTRVARIAYMQGTVSLQPAGADSWSEVPPNYPMISGDRIYTDQYARAIIQNGSTDVRLWGQTDVTLTNLNDQYEQIGIAQGSVRVRVFGIYPGNMVEVDTPNAAVFIQQPGDYRINAYDSQASLVEVNTGSVQITGPGINQQVDQGQAVQVAGSNPVELGLVTMPVFDDLDRWSIDRDHHILNSVSARYVSREIPGYDDLDDYGDWTVTPDYGPVWYPRAMPVGWQPYTIGHWAYVQPWGYTWVDDAAWGYAPFHYGRWAVIGGRWGWAPGPPAVVPVYSPALVAFVGPPPAPSGGAAFITGVATGLALAAWFPLGVAEPYVPWYHCTPNYVRTVNVTNINTTVIKNTTIINNYNVFINNTRNVTNVNQINVTNVNYVNRTHVYAVPANTFTSGVRVQQAAVHLNPQQQQQLAKAPVVVARPLAPPPARPVLQARSDVARPVARPALMTPHGVAPATPAANKATLRPVTLPKPQPAAAIKPAVKPVAPNLKPAAATMNRPTTPTQPGKPTPPANNERLASTTSETHPAPATRPGKPTPPANNVRTTPTMPETRPTSPTEPSKPVPPSNNVRPAPTAPETRPNEPSRPAPPLNNARQTPPPSNSRPAPDNGRVEPTQPARPIPPAKNVRPAPNAPEARPTSPIQPNLPAAPPNNARPTPAPNNTRTTPENRPVQPVQPTRPGPPPAQQHPQQQPSRPEAQPERPVPQQQVHPQAKTPPNEQKPEKKKKPEEEKKPEEDQKPQ